MQQQGPTRNTGRKVGILMSQNALAGNNCCIGLHILPKFHSVNVLIDKLRITIESFINFAIQLELF